MRLTPLALLLPILLLSACRSAPVSPEAGAPAPAALAEASLEATGPAPNDNLNAVVWVQTSVEYRMATEQTFRAATALLDDALADPRWDALAPEERDQPAGGLPPAVIVDVDETMLDNSPFQARMIHSGTGFDEVRWNDWVEERKARGIPGALAFATAAASRGIKVFYVTNRSQHSAAATLANLRAEGFPVSDDAQYLGLGTFVEGCEQNGSEKSCRRRLVGRTHRVLMQFGDQLGDFVGILANTPEGRSEALAPYEPWIGSRWWMVPNPTYGSWEPALFNNYWDQPDAERRRQKIEALRD